MTGSRHIYFAYGSNLHRGDWCTFCRAHGFDANSIRPIRRATLFDETLVFDYRSERRKCGALNIRPQTGCVVDGYLFCVLDGDWTALDAKEGHPIHYRRERINVTDNSGRRVEAQTYRVVERLRQSFVAPNDHYLAVCREGRVSYGLPIEPLDRVAAGHI